MKTKQEIEDAIDELRNDREHFGSTHAIVISQRIYALAWILEQDGSEMIGVSIHTCTDKARLGIPDDGTDPVIQEIRRSWLRSIGSHQRLVDTGLEKMRDDSH